MCGWYLTLSLKPPSYVWLQCDLMIAATLTAVTTMVLMGRVSALTPGGMTLFAYRFPTIVQAAWLSIVSQQSILLACTLTHRSLSIISPDTWINTCVYSLPFLVFMVCCLCLNAEVHVEFYWCLFMLLLAVEFSGGFDGRFMVLAGGVMYPCLLLCG